MATVRDLLTDAFVEAGILAANESLSAEDSAFALRKLNRLLERWSNDGFVVYKTVNDSLSIGVSTGLGATIGTGLTFNTQAPIQIISASLVISDVRHHLDLITAEEYAAIHSKQQSGQPSKLFFDSRGEGAYLRFWPKPDQTYTVDLFSKKKIVSYSALTDSVSLPAGFEDMIVNNMAVELSPSYGLVASQDLKDTAKNSFISCSRASFEPSKMTSDLTQEGVYNITSGQYET